MIDVSVDNYRQVFRSSAFTYFWVGFTVSRVGDSMARVALTWYVWDTTHSSHALGLLAFLYMAPILVGGVAAGWLLDKFGRRNVMLVDNVIRGGVVASIPLASALGDLHLWHVYLVAALYGSLMMISLAGSPALIPDLVSRKHLSTANALETIGFTVSSAVGPPVAGLLISRIGAPAILAIDSGSYFLFAWTLTRVPARTPTADPATLPDDRSYRLKDAFTLLLTNRVLLSTTLMYMGFNFGLGMLLVWLPIYADEDLGGGSRLFGILMGLMAGGSLVGSLLAGTVRLPPTLGVQICSILILSSLSLGLLLVDQSVWITAIGLTLFGLFNAPLTIWAQTLRMQIIPEPLRGRTFALLRMLMQSANPVGGLSAGPLVPAVGMVALIGMSALFVGVPGVLGLRVTQARTMRD